MQQADLRRVGVLVLVHEDRVVRGSPTRLGQRHGAVYQFGVVEDALRVEDVQVLGQELGSRSPVRPSGTPRERGQRVRPETQFPAAGEHRPYLVGETSGGQTGAELVGPP